MVVHAGWRASRAERSRMYAILNKARVSTSDSDGRVVWRRFWRTGADEYETSPSQRDPGRFGM